MSNRDRAILIIHFFKNPYVIALLSQFFPLNQLFITKLKQFPKNNL